MIRLFEFVNIDRGEQKEPENAYIALGYFDYLNSIKENWNGGAP